MSPKSMPDDYRSRYRKTATKHSIKARSTRRGYQKLAVWKGTHGNRWKVVEDVELVLKF